MKEHNVSTSHELEEPLDSYEISEATSAEKKWMLSLYPDYFRLEAVDSEPYEVDRAELRDRVQLLDNSPFLRRVLVVTLGKKKVFFKLSTEACAAVHAWIGPPTLEDLKLALKRRLSWVTPIGFLFVLSGLPIGGLPINPVSLGLGLMLIVTATLAKLWPHRIYFALDSLWFSFLAANSIWMLIQQWSWMRLVLLLLPLMLVQSGWREYRRFAPERMETGNAEEGIP